MQNLEKYLFYFISLHTRLNSVILFFSMMLSLFGFFRHTRCYASAYL